MTDKTIKYTLVVIAFGIWAIVLQNAGIIPTSQNVEVTNGVEVTGNVNVSGNVSVDNQVDVDIKKVNGWNAANYYEYNVDGKEFHSLGVK